MRIPLLIPLMACSLAACGGNDQDGASIALNTGNGAAAAGVNGSTGEIAVDLPGFKGQLDVPDLKLDADDIDLNGVTLYPGSTVRSMNIVGGREGTPDNLAIAFDSPADPGVVRDWFLDRLGNAGFDLTVEGNALVGTTDEADPFRMELAPSGSGTRGTIDIAT